jgi:hypothetical protein
VILHEAHVLNLKITKMFVGFVKMVILGKLCKFSCVQLWIKKCPAGGAEVPERSEAPAAVPDPPGVVRASAAAGISEW